MKIKKIIITISLILLVLVQDILLSIALIHYIEEKEEMDRRCSEAYFTDKGLTAGEMAYMTAHFQVDVDPLRTAYLLTEEHWPDYSYYTMEPSEDTEKIVSLINYHLFMDSSFEKESVIQMAKEHGFDKDNWITVEWVMENPKAAVAIYNELGYEGWHLRLIRAGYEVGDYHMFDESYGEDTSE